MYPNYLSFCFKVFFIFFFLILVGGSNPLKGDVLVIAGSMLYAISNVSEVIYICTIIRHIFRNEYA